MMSTAEFDTLVIGSGMGGLTTASLLAQLAGQRVLVLERHFKAGGFTHAFQRHQWSWDVGLHYVGEMQEGAQMRQLFDLINAGEVRWQKMPDPLEYFVYPEHRFALPAHPEQYLQDLQALFPYERRALESYFKDLKRLALFFQQRMMSLGLPTPLGKLLRWQSRREADFALQTTGQYLESRFRDPHLRGLLASQWGDYGLPPGQSALVIHALIVNHYLRGGCYPVGGAGVIAQSVEKILKQHGGEIRVLQEVREIICENGKAIGIRVFDRRPRAPEPEYIIAGSVKPRALVRGYKLHQAKLGHQ